MFRKNCFEDVVSDLQKFGLFVHNTTFNKENKILKLKKKKPERFNNLWKTCNCVTNCVRAKIYPLKSKF